MRNKGQNELVDQNKDENGYNRIGRRISSRSGWLSLFSLAF